LRLTSGFSTKQGHCSGDRQHATTTILNRHSLRKGSRLSTTRTSPRWNGTKIYFTGHSLHNEYRDLLIAPGNMRERFVDLIRQEADHARAGREAKIIHDRIDTDPFEAVADIVKSFPLVITWDDAIAVRGGVHPDWSLAEHERDDLLKMRAVPPENGYDGPARVFFGHTVFDELVSVPAEETHQSRAASKIL